MVWVMAEKESLEQKAAEWLANQGYLLEYDTYNAFVQQGLTANMTSYIESADGVKVGAAPPQASG